MPIARFICRGCGGREVDLDHFSKTACGESVCHPDYAAALLADRAGQYTSGSVRVTHGLSCPRRAAIEESESFAVDPLDANAPLTGVAWHSLMEKFGSKTDCEVEVSGTVGGVALKGKIDRIRMIGDEMILEDWKHINDFSVKYIKQDGAKLEHRVQLSIYAELVHQCMQVRPVRGIIWYHSSVGGKDALIPQPVSLISVEDALKVHPYGCDYTVDDLYKQMDLFFAFQPKYNWKTALPLAGASIRFGSKTGCDYCSVRSICMEAETGSPF